MSRVNRFAPVSGAPSSLIGVASLYFMFSGVLVAALTLIALLVMPAEMREVGPLGLVLGSVLNIGAAAGMFWTGKLLGRHSRRGGYYALGFVLLSLLTSLDTFTVAFTVLSLIVLASIWRDLK